MKVGPIRSRIGKAAVEILVVTLLAFWVGCGGGTDEPVDAGADAATDGWDALDGGGDPSTGDPGSDGDDAGADLGDPEVDGGDPGEDGGDSAADAGDPGPAVLTSLSPQELQQELGNKDFLLINVHVPRAGEIPGTDVHITYLDPEAIAAFIGPDLDERVVIYCRSNHMALIAGDDLIQRGYRSIRYLDGGMNAWEAAGYGLDP